jgi:hypothetical protein
MTEILTPAQVAERLQVGVSWIYEQTRNRASVRNPDPLPHIQNGPVPPLHVGRCPGLAPAPRDDLGSEPSSRS